MRIRRVAPGIVFCATLYPGGVAASLPAQDHVADDHHLHHHHVAFMAGGMTPLSETSETSFALGADYEYRIDERWGGGAGADFTFGDHKRAALFAGGASYRPLPALKVGTGPGLELVETDKPSGGMKNSTYFVWWVGASWEFHIGSLSVGPILYLDFVGETKTNLTYGATIGTGF